MNIQEIDNSFRMMGISHGQQNCPNVLMASEGEGARIGSCGAVAWSALNLLENGLVVVENIIGDDAHFGAATIEDQNNLAIFSMYKNGLKLEYAKICDETFETIEKTGLVLGYFNSIDDEYSIKDKGGFRVMIGYVAEPDQFFQDYYRLRLSHGRWGALNLIMERQAIKV